MLINILFHAILWFQAVIWSVDFSASQAEASSSHKLILLNFSGSDWCGPCIRLRKEILETTSFESFAKEKLVLVRADFPRLKQHQLSAEQVKRNEAVAELYNQDGKFPYTLLIDDHGKVLRSWDGFPNETTEQFIAEIKKYSYVLH